LQRASFVSLCSTALPLDLSIASTVAMSKAWSCETLKHGFNSVIDDALKDEEKRLEKELEE